MRYCYLNCNCITQELIYSMKGYVRQALIELQHIPSKQTHIGPSKIERPDYSAKIQHVKGNDTDALMDNQTNYLQ